jgi:hypothetical protein
VVSGSVEIPNKQGFWVSERACIICKGGAKNIKDRWREGIKDATSGTNGLAGSRALAELMSDNIFEVMISDNLVFLT